MKFDNNPYWKHKNCLDVFFNVSSTARVTYGKNIILYGTWCTQGTESWWFTISDRLNIRPDQYENWDSYEPKGRMKL